jgi:hypothetical protein
LGELLGETLSANNGAKLSDPFGLELNPVHDPTRKLFEIDDRFLDVAIWSS